MNKTPKSQTITGIRARWYNKLMAGLGVGSVYRQAHFLLKPQGNEHLLDIGCGTGTFLKELRKQEASFKLCGIDASEDMLQEAKSGVSGITFLYADASKLPFEDASFDCVISILALHHMPHDVKRQAIGEAVRVVKPDGRIIILDLLRPNSWWGRIFGLWLNFHSHTRGNWDVICSELQEKGFIIAKEGTVRGFVGYLLARPSQVP